MLPLFRYVLLGLGCLECLVQHVGAQRVVRFPLHRRNRTSTLDKRDPFAISMQNYIPGAEYFVTALVGTPGQAIEFVVDTGSSDIWMFGPGACQRQTSFCQGGEFDISSSSTAQYVPGDTGKFKIQYVSAGSGVTGNYFTDNFNIGGETVQALTMAVATFAKYVPSGIMGIGLPLNEAAVTNGMSPFPTFPDLLVAQNKIATKSYSLYLDDYTSSTGMMIFGGYDEEKFRGNIVMLPIQPDSFNSGKLSSFVVSWTSLGFSDNGGDYNVVTSGEFLYPATMDTGTTLTYVPSEIYVGLESYFNVVSRGKGNPGQIDCDFGKKNPGQLIYGFGGPGGVQVAVEFDELIVPLYSRGTRATARDGTPFCAFGIVDAGNEPLLFGQTFLRSAYVLYDLDNMQVGIAQTVFGSSGSRVLEYTGRSGADRINTIQGPAVTGEGGNVNFASTYPAGVVPPGAASAIQTDFKFSTIPYPSGSFPASFPTSIPFGPTGVIPISEVNDHTHTTSRVPSSSTSRTSHTTAQTSTSKSTSSTSSSRESSSRSTTATSTPTPSKAGSSQSSGNGNSAPAGISPAFGTAIVSLLAILGIMVGL